MTLSRPFRETFLKNRYCFELVKNADLLSAASCQASSAWSHLSVSMLCLSFFIWCQDSRFLQCAGHGCPVGPRVRQGPDRPHCFVIGQGRSTHLQPGFGHCSLPLTGWPLGLSATGVGQGLGRGLGKAHYRISSTSSFLSGISPCHVCRVPMAQLGEGQNSPVARRLCARG